MKYLRKISRKTNEEIYDEYEKCCEYNQCNEYDTCDHGDKEIVEAFYHEYGEKLQGFESKYYFNDEKILKLNQQNFDIESENIINHNVLILSDNTINKLIFNRNYSLIRKLIFTKEYDIEELSIDLTYFYSLIEIDLKNTNIKTLYLIYDPEKLIHYTTNNITSIKIYLPKNYDENKISFLKYKKELKKIEYIYPTTYEDECFLIYKIIK